jgi:pyridoxal phosphate enzyme (YggS family)
MEPGSEPVADPEPIALGEALATVRSRIAAAGADPDRIRIVAVTKGFGRSAVRAALHAGLTDLGENYPQELAAKAAWAPEARWHLIGPPQRNKIRRLAPLVALWQAVERVEVVERLASLAPAAAILVQVNATGEAGKAGCTPEQAADLVGSARRLRLDVRGLMCVGAAGDPDGTQRAFRRVASLAEDLGVEERSMGMSDDLEIAVGEGSTMLRLGRALFGPRPGRAGVRR